MILYIRVRKSYFQISDFYMYFSVIYVIYNHNSIYMYVLSYHLSIKIIFGVSITILSMKKISYAYFMTHFVYTVKWHIGNVFNKPPCQNAPADRVLTSVILKGIEWAFRKVYPTKIPGMVHRGLLAPQSYSKNTHEFILRMTESYPRDTVPVQAFQRQFTRA